ncbi:MAG: hypothetical protein LBK95_09060, partial [Bifidobacteriaceae bacterium]|nr:hypothetical protein [Bifidobacteriaceae bacterium]
MRKRFGRRGVGVIASLTLAAAAAPLLGACEATPAKDDPSLGVPTSETPSANAEAAEYEPTQFTEVPGGLPLTPYFDAYHALDQAVQTGQSMRERADWLNEREAETASCMKKAGFEYYPRQVEAADFFSTNPFVALEGDMVAVSYLPDTLAEVQATGYGIRPVTDPADKPVNPTEPDPTEEDIKNQEYREGLSASAGAAYDMALTGWDGTDEGRDAEVGGCAAVVDQKHPEPAADDS